MALVKSLGVGKGVKSAGNLTYRTVRGRTIASEKVGSTAAIREAAYSNDGKLNERCSAFGMMAKFAAAHKSSIMNSFPKSKFGSEVNTFMKLNKKGFYAALQALAEAGGIATIGEIESALSTYAAAHPNAIYRWRLTASKFEYLTGAWNDEDDPVGRASVSAISGTINSSYMLSAIVVTGENLTSDLRCYVNGAIVSGSWNINAAGTSGTFTLSASKHIYGTATIAVKNGANTLKSGSVVGDPNAPTYDIKLNNIASGGNTSTELATMSLNVSGDLPSEATLQINNGASASFQEDRSKVQVTGMQGSTDYTLSIVLDGATIYTLTIQNTALPMGS